MNAQIKGAVVRNANPEGCVRYLNDKWQLLSTKPAGKKSLSVLVIGSSSGFGLASRLTALRNGAEFSVGVCYERAPDDKQGGSAGWHLDQAFQSLASANHHKALTFNRDSFLTTTKQAVIDAALAENKQFDLVIYSVAAGVKLNEQGEKIRSSILPTNQPITGLQVDLAENRFSTVQLPAATQQQIDHTVEIMGGQDWADWIHALKEAQVLSDNAITYNYSYLGSELNSAIYRDGSLGAAKNHMHNTAAILREQGFNARAVVCKALVTKASLFIPTMAPYLMALKTELSPRQQDEDVFDQMYRLLSDDVVEEGDLLRLDNHELAADVQAGIKKRLDAMTEDSFNELIDFQGVRHELLAMHGFFDN